ncbi:unnamed protein product [Clonostachys solani]|uniref:Uncharacterized protein n=1 Tax=Clonostachys solani TaxID=160281 RepID=A0A9P0EKS9_9HYPO|nr:unnamed protein product [Clonostachys solani]
MSKAAFLRLGRQGCARAESQIHMTPSGTSAARLCSSPGHSYSAICWTAYASFSQREDPYGPLNLSYEGPHSPGRTLISAFASPPNKGKARGEASRE